MKASKLIDPNLKQILALIAHHPRTVFRASFFIIIQATALPISTWIIAIVIDRLTSGEYQIRTLFLLIALAMLITAGARLISANIGLALRDLTIKLLHDILDMSYGKLIARNLDKKSREDFETAYANSMDNLERIVDMLFDFIGAFVIQFLIALVIIFLNFDIKYGLLMLAFGVVPVILTLPIYRKINVKLVKARDSMQHTNRNVRKLVFNLSLIKIYQTRRFEKSRLDEEYANYARDLLDYHSVWILAEKTRAVLEAVIITALLFLLVWDIAQGAITIGQFFLFFTYVTVFIEMISWMPHWIASVDRLIKKLEPILALSNEEEDLDEATPPAMKRVDRLSVKNFQCSYLPQLDAHAEYVFERGEIYWLRGENGAGKSTFLQAMMGMNDEARVDVSVETGGKQRALSADDRAVYFSYSEQEPKIWARAVAHNLEYAKHGDFGTQQPADFTASLEAMPAFERIAFSKSADDLSGGQTQLVHVYRAIGKFAPVLLLDEPTNALDGEVILELIKTLRSIAPDTIIIIATHSEYLQKITTKELRIVQKPKK